GGGGGGNRVDQQSGRHFIASGTGAVVIGAASSRGDRQPESVVVFRGWAMKTIGVLGGMGPQATMDFDMRVHRVAQRLIPPHFNGGYPPMVVYYCRHAPILVTDTGMPKRPLRPDPRLLEAAKRLGGLADFVVIPCNGAHLFQAEIEQAAGRKVLSMIEATLEEVRRRQRKRVGVLGLGDPVIYTEPLGRLGIAWEIADAERRAALDGAVFRLMEGRDDAESAAAARAAGSGLPARRVDGVILGGTEVPP